VAGGDVVVRIAGDDDLATIAALRAQWTGETATPEFERALGAWLADEGDRRTVWLAMVGGEAVGLASVFEYRRMPRPGRMSSRWGYVSNMFVLEGFRGRGIGSVLLRALTDAADERGYPRLVLSPTLRAVSFYERAGFVVPDERAGDENRLLVRLAV
jgi:GNAT superfamily N-acetyltransferase